MKAYNLHGVGDLRYEEIEIPQLKNGWCLVKVRAAGICSSDIPRVFEKGTYSFPTIPGHEFSGEVICSYNHKMIGKKVGVFPLIPCKKCVQCQKKHYEMCEQYGYLGSRCDGGFSEYVLVPTWNLVELPATISFEIAAMLEPLAVALHATKMANISRDTSFAVIGTGMIGLAAAQWAKYFGAAEIIIVGRNESKRSYVEQFEGINYINSSKESLPKVDISLEAVGTSESINDSIEVACAGGKVILMGNPAGNIQLCQDTYWKILRKQLIVKGTWNSFYDGNNMSDWTEVVQVIESGEINVAPMITHRFSKDKLIDGLNMMRNHKEPYCKVMTVWE